MGIWTMTIVCEVLGSLRGFRGAQGRYETGVVAAAGVWDR